MLFVHFPNMCTAHYFVMKISSPNSASFCLILEVLQPFDLFPQDGAVGLMILSAGLMIFQHTVCTWGRIQYEK